ncbi:MAG: S1C family serine protease [Steroidobacteraceae bacterium]
MDTNGDWAFPEELQPHGAELAYDLAAALAAAVLLRADVPEDAFTAGVLGTERIGNGVVIRHGDQDLVLTVGYLVTEATSIWLTTHDGRAVPAHLVACDTESGLGLVQPLGPLGVPALTCGSAAGLTVGSPVTVVGHGGAAHSVQARVIARREFAGYWEYLIDAAIFTAPPHPLWGGTALVDALGRVVGIGSLLTQAVHEDETFDANMYVPVDLLLPVIGELVRCGRRAAPARPWLGVYLGERGGRVVVAEVVEGSPAQRAGLRPGDALLMVAGRRVATLAEFLRAVWAQGGAGVEVPLTLVRERSRRHLRLRSVDRESLLRRPSRH